MGPLHGLRVLDLCTEAGVYCTKLLTDLGAQVIKVESLDGSPERRRPPFFKGNAASSLSFLHYNRNELSVTLGLALDEGRRLFHELVKASDIMVEDGLPPQLGLNYETMRQINPSLVYASITGYGSTGPRAGWAYSDLSTQATSGIMYRIGFPEDPPNSMGAEFAYHQASGHATAGILTAVIGRDAGGEGRHVDVSIQESMSIMQYDALPTYITRGVLIKRAGHGQGSSGKRYRRIWDTKKGLVRFQLVSQTSDREWPLLLDWMAESGAGGELRDERWNDPEERTAHPAVFVPTRSLEVPGLRGVRTNPRQRLNRVRTHIGVFGFEELLEGLTRTLVADPSERPRRPAPYTTIRIRERFYERRAEAVPGCAVARLGSRLTTEGEVPPDSQELG